MTDETIMATDKALPDEAAYAGWAVVEIMGHKKIAGLCKEVNQFGALQLRVDVPGPDGSIVATQFYSGSSIYCLTPCDEAMAMAALRNKWSLPEPVQLALRGPDNPALPRGAIDVDDFEDDDRDHDEFRERF